MFDSASLPLLLLIFGGAAAFVWVAGVRLSDTTDILSSRFGLGEALGGLIMLAIVTNLPEIAITASAALSQAMEVSAVLDTIASGFAWIALAAWVATFFNMLVSWCWRPPASRT